MSNKFNLSNELKGYKEWLLANKKGFTVTVAGTTVVVTLVAGLVAVPLNNAKNTAQGNYQRVLTRFNEIKEVQYKKDKRIQELEKKLNDTECEKYELEGQLKRAEASKEDTDEAEASEEVTEEQAEITPYIPTMEDEQALISAQQYLDLGFGFSREGMRQQLEYEGFSDTAIGYALDSLY